VPGLADAPTMWLATVRPDSRAPPDADLVRGGRRAVVFDRDISETGDGYDTRIEVRIDRRLMGSPWDGTAHCSSPATSRPRANPIPRRLSPGQDTDRG